jgi:two-component system response regulator AtoC
MASREARRVLIVDDDAAIRTSLAEAVGEWASEVRVAADATEALSRIAERVPDLVLSDVRMPGTGGLDLLRLLRERAPSTDVVLMTAYEDMNTVVGAMREGAIDFIMKPIALDTLHDLVERVFEDRRARRAVGKPKDDPASYSMDTLVGRDPRMIEAFKRVGQAAAGRANVLIRGESGTGKELIARAVHFNAHDADKPFVPINCAALPTTLLESELFGHTRGAYTGAVGARRGRFALAGNGTIFLDEIGDTTLEFQSKLLRVLQEREFYPLGADEAERTEARVIAATHQNLEQLVAEGRFREDVYYRLRIVEIVLPPLRERVADIPSLAQHLVHKAATSAGYAEPVISREAIGALLDYPWPGNVRELENCLTRATVLAAGSVIRPDHLALKERPKTGDGPLPSLEDLERAHIVRVLAFTEGQKNRAAEILGVSRPRLNRLLQKHGLE